MLQSFLNSEIFPGFQCCKNIIFACLEPAIIKTGTLSSKSKIVKCGSGYLRYSLMNAALTVNRYNKPFMIITIKKISEGKCHRVALFHACKKNIRVIYILN